MFSLLMTSSCKPDDNSDENNNVQEYELIVTGNISDFINDDNKLRITKLIINSSILSDDWSLLSEMASIGSLEILDLTNVTIVGEEHNPYYNDNEIPEYAFTACNKLKEVYLPSNLQSIAKEAFSRCKKLKKVHFPETIEYIAPRAFYSTALSGEFFVPKNIKIIGMNCNYSIIYDKMYVNAIISPSSALSLFKSIISPRSSALSGSANNVSRESLCFSCKGIFSPCFSVCGFSLLSSKTALKDG